MAGLTNKFQYTLFDCFFRGATVPGSFYQALVTAAAAPDADTNTLSDLTELTAGNGYTAGGEQLTRNSTGFPALTEDDANNRADLTLKTVTWTASGTWPSSGAGARYVTLLDDNGTVGSRKVFAYFDIGSVITMTSGQAFATSSYMIRESLSTLGWTNRGAYRALDYFFRGATPPTNFYVALVTSATAPTATTNTLSDLTQIAAGNGYTTGGFSLSRNSTDFDSLTEDDGNDRGRMLLKDVTWTASGGSIPGSGSGARYAVVTDDNATVGSREVYYYWSLSSDRTATVGQTITLADFIVDGNS